MDQARVFPSRRQIHARPRDLAESPADVRHALEPSVEEPSKGIPVYAIVLCALVVLAIFVGGYFLSRGSAPEVLAVFRTLDPVTVTGKQGGSPVVTVAEPVSVDETEFEVRFRGDGRQIVAGSPVLLAVSAYDGRYGTNLRESGAPALVVGTADPSSIGASLSDIVLGQTEGSRLVVARQLSSGETEINVVDVLYSIAKGTPVETQDGPLTVTATEQGITVTPGSGEPPTDLTIQVLLQGSGPQVAPGDQVVAQYLAVGWSDGAVSSSTWEEGTPRTIDLQAAWPGIREALVDHRVGSRLAITIPPEKATGEDTMCIVVDILGTVAQIGTDFEDAEEKR